MTEDLEESVSLLCSQIRREWNSIQRKWLTPLYLNCRKKSCKRNILSPSGSLIEFSQIQSLSSRRNPVEQLFTLGGRRKQVRCKRISTSLSISVNIDEFFFKFISLYLRARVSLMLTCTTVLFLGEFSDLYRNFVSRWIFRRMHLTVGKLKIEEIQDITIKPFKKNFLCFEIRA